MKNRFVVSDWHLGHTNSWEKFKKDDGTPLRPFTSTEEMNETMIERHNAVVKPDDVVYVLGDIVINKKFLPLVKRFNGHLRLCRGNHDIFKDREYAEVGFEQIWGVRVFVDKFILSHIPLHPASITNRFKVNIHGHLHAGFVPTIASVGPGVTDCVYTNEPDPRYLCVSVEHTDYRPLHFDEVQERIQKLWDKTGYEAPNGWFNGSGPG